MAYYPKSQVTTNLYTYGEEYVIQETGRPYTGPYYKTSKGKFFAGENPEVGNDNTPLIRSDEYAYISEVISPEEELNSPLNNPTLTISNTDLESYAIYTYPKRNNYSTRLLPKHTPTLLPPSFKNIWGFIQKILC